MLYKCLVIGSGPSSEPVIYHLSKTNFKTLIVDSDDLFAKRKVQLCKNKKIISGYSPKQKLKGLERIKSNHTFDLSSNIMIRSLSFLYSYTFLSGGLSNFWGGLISEWDDEEIKKTTSIPVKWVRSSYKNLKKRLNILQRTSFSEISPIGKSLLRNLKKNLIFKPSEFILSENLIINSQIPFNQNLIWNSKDTISKYVENNKNLKYKAHTKVVSINKENNYYVVTMQSKNNFFKVKAQAIFLCAGTINSTSLALSAFNKKIFKTKLRHSSVCLAPVFSLKKIDKEDESFFENNKIEFSELSWSLVNNHNIIKTTSGFYLNSSFLFKKIISNSFFRSNTKIIKILSILLARIGFIILYENGEYSETYINIKKYKKNKTDFWYQKITIKTCKSFLKNKFKSYRNLIDLSKYLPRNVFLLFFLSKKARNGADIHYGCTMPEKSLINTEIRTDKYGEVIGLKNIFSCDPSRLSFLSSKSHTFTSMAIVDYSMPFIIKKLKILK